MTSPDASSPSLPSGVVLAVDHGADAVVVDIPAASAVIHLDGAHVSSWVPAGGSEVLWLSPASAFGAGAAIRGGIPLVGPWFGPGRGGDQEVKHGWLRNVRWELVSAVVEADAAVLELVTPDGHDDLTARLSVRIGRELSLDLAITAGGAALELEAALHTYLAVSDVREIAIEGVGGASYLDNTRGLVEDLQPEGALRLTGSTDRIFATDGEIRVVDAGRTIVSTPRGSATTVVWNPWAELAAGMADIPDDAWPQFVCVEPAVNKDRFVALAAGETHTLGVTYRIEA
ncbi:D-hexose-6-phosphate mutarotase [Brachybacterium sp. DNPG3]